MPPRREPQIVRIVRFDDDTLQAFSELAPLVRELHELAEYCKSMLEEIRLKIQMETVDVEFNFDVE